MKEKRKQILVEAVITVSLIFLGLVLGCGEYKYPESNADEVEKTGFIIATTDQQNYDGEVKAVNCDALASIPPDVDGAGTIDPPETVEAEWKFVFKINPALPDPPPYIVVDRCCIRSSLYEWDWDDKEDCAKCGPWIVEPTPTSEETLTVEYVIFSQGLLNYLIYPTSAGGLEKPIPAADTIYLTIFAHTPFGEEVSATSYAGLSISCESKSTSGGGE